VRSEFRNVLALYMRQNIVTVDNSLEIMDAVLEMMSGEEYEVASYLGACPPKRLFGI